MKRLSLAILTFFVFSASSNAAHIIGGEMRYIYMGLWSALNSKIYQIVMILFKGYDPSGAPLSPSFVVGIFDNDTRIKVPGIAANNNWTITRVESDPWHPGQAGLIADIAHHPGIHHGPKWNRPLR